MLIVLLLRLPLTEAELLARLSKSPQYIQRHGRRYSPLFEHKLPIDSIEKVVVHNIPAHHALERLNYLSRSHAI